MNRWIGIGITIITLIVIGFIVAAAIFPDFRVASRDIAIIILAVFQMIATIITIVLLLALWYAVVATRRTINQQLIPRIEQLSGRLDGLMQRAQDTVGNVQQTTAATSKTTVYIAERVVSPIIRISSLIAGVRAGATTLARGNAAEEPVISDEPQRI